MTNEIHCPLCEVRVSTWMIVSGKTKDVGKRVVHKACLIDYKLKHGFEYTDLKTDWSLELYEE